jgi:hypothetical protein
MAALVARAAAKAGPSLLKAAPSLLSGLGSSAANAANAGPVAAPPVSGFQGAITEKDVLRTVDEMRRAETLELVERKKLRAMERMAKGNLKLFILALLKDLSPYIVLALVIFVIVMLMKGGAAAASRSRRVGINDPTKRSEFAKVKSRTENIMDAFLKKFQVIIDFFTPGYRMRTFLNMFSPNGPRYNAIPRTQMKSGRCDNLRWIQVNNDMDKSVVLNMDGQAGKCYSAVLPKDIVWELDPNRMGELYELPKTRQDQLKNKMTVTIPYTSDDSIKDGNTFFYPRCNDAYFGNDPNDKANMFEDLGTSCKITSFPLAKALYNQSLKKSDLVATMR